MFEVMFLGTSASAPSIQRGLSAQVVIHKEYRFLVDCGEGTQRQILRSGIGFRRLDKILLTHSHLDHILGLGGLISTFARWETAEQIEVWGGKSTLDRVYDLIYGVVLRGARPSVNIELYEVKPGVLMEDDEFVLSAFPVEHRGPDCFGYTFERKSHRPFMNDLAESLGVPRGPERRQLVNGQSVHLEDGRTILPDDVLGDPIPGDKLCITGDIGRTAGLSQYIAGADALISEATYLNYEVDLARRFGHITAREAAELAFSSDVKNLMLTHISRRYREHEIAAEANETFPGAVVVRDFDHFRIRSGCQLERVEE
ncbi:MAG: MBL fold metallo-hydrolase [Anaerolineae bacterium]|nr:MBL fold metallo-hydrolase [Anaerolineae bacterium]